MRLAVAAQAADIASFLVMVSLFSTGTEANPIVAELLAFGLGIPIALKVSVAVFGMAAAAILVQPHRTKRPTAYRLAATGIVGALIAAGLVGAVSNIARLANPPVMVLV